MSVRAVDTVKGVETTLAVDKAGGETPVYVIVKCATSINYGGERETLTANCYGGTEEHISGNDPAFTVTIQGITKEYAAADLATNVSANDFEDLFLSGEIRKYRYGRPHVGDRIRSFDGFVSAFSEAGEANGFQTYNVTIKPRKKPVITVVA